MNKFQGNHSGISSITSGVAQDSRKLVNQHIIPPKSNQHIIPPKSNMFGLFRQANDINRFIGNLQEFLKNAEFENLIKYVEAYLPDVYEYFPNILFWIYKCWFLNLKKHRKVQEADYIYKTFLLPVYKKSEKFRQKITTFSVILHSQNLNFSELCEKIDKYSAKLVRLLHDLLLAEISQRKHMTNRCEAQAKMHVNPTPRPICQNKHLEILSKLVIGEDDSSLSDLEDDIMKTCTTSYSVKQIRQSEIFEITKERKSKVENSDRQSEQMQADEFDKKTLDVEMEQAQEAVGFQEEFENQGIKGFQKFAEEVQGSEIYKPINTLSKMIRASDQEDSSYFKSSMASDSRKFSASTMEVEDAYDPELCTSTHSNHLSLKSNKLSLKRAKNYNIDATIEQCSNMNLYRKPYVPKCNKSKEKLKNLVPFLKEFNPKFLKKENIDKKILRKFRNYVKISYKQDDLFFNEFDKDFWRNFTVRNLLPPMKFYDNKILVEFKSFNTKYMLWLFSKKGSIELYQQFSSKNGEEILKNFIGTYNLEENSKEEGIIAKLRHYIYSIQDIYAPRTRGLLENVTQDNKSICNVSYTTKLLSEEILDDYLGPEINNFNKTFLLNNFDGALYQRCGKKFHEPSDDYYESYCNFAESGLNISMDSIQSVE